MMHRLTQPWNASPKRLMTRVSLAPMAKATASGNAFAISPDFGSFDVQVRLDTAALSNLGIRGESINFRLNKGLAGTSSVSNNNAVTLGNDRSDDGDVIPNRFDVLSDFTSDCTTGVHAQILSGGQNAWMAAT